MQQGTLWQTADEISGEVEKILFRNENSSFTVMSVRTEEEKLTATGYCDGLYPGRRYLFKGDWNVHPRYGRQFKITSYEEILPTTCEGLKAYLGGGFVPGVGEKMAARLVDYFGEKTLEVIDEQPHKLQEVSGIGSKTANKIKEAVKANRELEKTMIFLQSHGITARMALKIYKHYGTETLNIVRDNPFQLTADVSGIGFFVADRIARQFGLLLHDVSRLQAGVRHILNEAVYQEGQCFLCEKRLLQKSLALVNTQDIEEPIEEEEVLSALDKLVGNGELVREGERIYPLLIHKAEETVAEQFNRLGKTRYECDNEKIEEIIKQAETEMGLYLAPRQIEVIKSAINNGLMVVTGGPGTGKSTIVSGIIQVILSGNKNAVIHLAAPTGRAAKRLSELTGLEAKTIHRLLGFRWEEGKGVFNLDKNKQLEGDLLVVDEFSMVDLLLANNLFQAIPGGMRVVLVGDVDQLPSVGPGQVLRDIIDSAVVPTVKLTHIFRQAETSQIVTNAHRVNRGEMIKTNVGKDFQFIRQDDPHHALEIIKRIVKKAVHSLDLEEVQVITPMHNHTLGVENINKVLQGEINPASPQKKEYQFGKTVFRMGDKVMVVKNNYEKGVFNGNLGKITDIIKPEEKEELKEDTLLVDIDSEIIPYGRSELDELTLAYAITVHKAQGSEFTFCLLPLSTQHWFMLQRNLFYTALTRGKKMVILVGSHKALWRAIKNDKVQRRNTTLTRKLQALFKQGNLTEE